MLPQMVSLDVMVERGTRKLITAEINGERSGYQGLVALGTDLSEPILNVIGDSLPKGRLLVNPLTFEEFSLSKGTLAPLQRLWQERRVTVAYLPLRIPLSVGEFQSASGINLQDYDALFGFGMFLREPGMDERMTNAPAVELAANDKLLQYELLRDIPELNIPESWFFDSVAHLDRLARLMQAHGKTLVKPRHGMQGNGIRLLEVELAHYLASEVSKIRPKPKVIFTGRGQESQSHGNQKVTFRLVYKDLSSPLEAISKLYEADLSAARSAARERLEEYGIFVQKFIETEPVRDSDDGQPHFAAARLLYFGGYLGGYWRLSSKPVSDADPLNAIVNFSRSGKAQRFTPEEAEMFKGYGERIFPLILGRLFQYNGRLEAYAAIEDKVFQDTIQLQTSNHVILVSR